MSKLLFSLLIHPLTGQYLADVTFADDQALLRPLLPSSPYTNLHKCRRTDVFPASASRELEATAGGVDVMQAGSLPQPMDTIHPGKQIHVLLYYMCARFHPPFNPVINDRA